MSTIFDTPAATHASPWTSRLTATLKRWWLAYITWRLERAVIDQLWSMSERDLKDIGLTRSEISAAVKGDVTRERTFRRFS